MLSPVIRRLITRFFLRGVLRVNVPTFIVEPVMEAAHKAIALRMIEDVIISLFAAPAPGHFADRGFLDVRKVQHTYSFTAVSTTLPAE